MSATDDIVAIQQLLARHNTAVDAGDGEGYAATWTAEGVSVTPQTTTSGRAALTELGATAAGSMPGLRHWVTNHAVAVDGDEAHATVYLMALVGGPDARILATGRYIDELRRTPEGWRFSRREFVLDGE